MDRLLRRVREALAGAARPEHPGPAPSRGDGDPAALAARFSAELERAAGKFRRAPDEAAARALVAREYGGGDDVGIDTADVLLAETGTVLRSYATREESRVSLVPAVSVFLATADALVPDLPAALERVAPAHRAGRAYTVMITGPSRTADIEKELVIPAHGPRELVVVLIG